MDSLILLFAILGCSQGLTVHAPYQVGLYLFDSYNPNFGAKNFPICSGVIVHPLFCLTAADCVHAHISAQSISRPLLPTSLYIKSGNFTDTRENIKYITTIHVHPGYNSTTLKNDIALLQIESSFQFEYANNERWVQLGSHNMRNDKCIYSINTPNATEAYPFSALKQTTVVNNSFCHDNKASHIGDVDLCSFYDFDHAFMCQVPENQLRLNRDRGTPIICDNKLVGILSAIIPANSSDICAKTLRTHAYFTKVSLHDKWMHSVIGVNTPPHTAEGKPISIVPNSPPFQITGTGNSTLSTASTLNLHPMITVIAFVTCLWVRKFADLK